MPDAAFALERGQKFPYDANDDWWHDAGDPAPPPAVDWAHAAARGVLGDLTDRRDVKRGFENVDEDVRSEIVSSLAEIIRLSHARQPK